MKNKVVYHNVFKFGYVISEDNDSKRVLFNNVGEKNIVNSFLRDVDSKTYDYLINEKYKSSFDTPTFSRGLNYARENKVKDYTLATRSQSIKGIVVGTEEYETVAEKNSDKFTFICSCPVGFSCKHAAALMIYLNNEFKMLDKLEDNYLNTSNNVKENKISDTMDYSNITNLINAGNLVNENSSIDILKNYSNELSKCDSNGICSYLGYLLQKNEYKYQLKYLFFNSKARKIGQNLNRRLDEAIFFKNNFKDYNSIISLYSNAEGFVPLKNIEEYLIYCFMNNKIKYALNCLLDNAENIVDLEKYSEFLGYIKKNYSQEEIYIFIVKILSEWNYNDVLKIIKRLLDDSYVRKIISDEDISFGLGIEDLGYFNDAEIFEAINRISYSENLCKYILNETRLKSIDSFKYLGLLEKMYFNCNTKLKRNLLAYIEDYPDSLYLCEYLETLDKYDWLCQVDAIDFDYDIFSKYLHFSYVVENTRKNVYIIYNLMLDDGSVILSVKTNEFDKLISTTSSNRFFQAKYQDAFIKYSKLVFHEEINEKFQAELEKIKKEKYEEDRRNILRSLDRFDSFINKNNSIIPQAKPHLEVSISSSYREIGMSLKIGVNKMYIGKGTYEILMNFYRNETYKYGKELTFSHNLENMMSPYDKLVKYFISIPERSWKTNYSKDVEINSGMFENILKILVGENIIFDNKNYLIVDEDFSLNYLLDENYKLIIDSKYNFFATDSLIIAFDEETHTLRFKNVSMKDMALFSFTADNKDKSLESVAEEVKNSIISRYNNIMVCDKLKDQFKISELKIDAYFDFVNKYLTLSTKLYKDDKEATRESLNEFDKSKLAGYHNYLQLLGFVEGICKDNDAIYNFFQMDFSDLKRFANVYLSESIQNKKIISLGVPTINMSYQSGMMDVFIEDSMFSDRELEEIIKALRHKKKYVILKDDRIVDLNDDNAYMFENIVDDMHLDIKNLSQPQPMPLYQVLNAYAIKNNVKMDEYLSNMIDNISGFKSADIKLPDINANLRQYQKEGYYWLSILTSYHLGGILADDMGLGKTLQIITLIASNDCKMPSLIVCPKSLIFNWLNEFHKFAPNIRVVGVHGNQVLREEIIKGINSNENVVYITSYDSIRSDISLYNNLKFNFIILDEAQYIKNSQALKSISVKQLDGANRFALTGTPIENNILDLWSIFDFIMPGYFEEVSTFKSRYQSEESYSDRILKKISPFILRRTKENVLSDLPSKYERIVSAEMTKEQRKLYDAHRKIAKDALIAGGKSFDILPILTRLRQICVDPAMFVESYEGQSGKLELFYDMVDEYISNGHRILVFSQFVKCLEDVEVVLNKKNIKYLKITGQTSASDRVSYANLFNNDDSISLFLISLKAGGTGLNLIGADTVIHLDPWWNVAAENQATDRAHRIGQTKNVEVIKFICENSIEQRVIELQNFKKDIIDKFISNDESSISSITREDLSFILD